MISIITYGRNDNYGYNLYKRTALGFNCFAEVLTDEDEILFVDYNTPPQLPTLPEFIWDTLTPKARSLLKVVRVAADLHAQLKRDSPLPILESVARNAAIVRSNPRNRWILSTNPDVLMVVASEWTNLPELLASVPESFYEMPRFDIPEGVWSHLRRDDPQAGLRLLRDWIVANRAAVVETIPDHRFQKYYLFDAPGDFQLAPRSYFFKLRGFDESMNKYLHSDSNLAKRMWLLNGRRTDHLLGKLWVLHQDHYLSGEWAQNVATISHNDYHAKVLLQSTIEANDEDWGLQKLALPFFGLEERVRRAQSYHFNGSQGGPSDSLPLNGDVDWSCQTFYRICHYQPQLLAVYLREILETIPPESSVVYLGKHNPTWDAISRLWSELGDGRAPIRHLVNEGATGEKIPADLLLVDCYFDRPADVHRRIALLRERLRDRQSQGEISEEEANAELNQLTDSTDSQLLENGLIPLWQHYLRRLRMSPGSHVILLGCNTYLRVFFRFQEMFMSLVRGVRMGSGWLQALHDLYQRFKFHVQAASARSRIWKMALDLQSFKRRRMQNVLGYESAMGKVYYQHMLNRTKRIRESMYLPTLYVHHRLVVMRVGK